MRVRLSWVVWAQMAMFRYFLLTNCHAFVAILVLALPQRVKEATMERKLTIDFEHLRKYTAGDVQIEREILEIFTQQADIWVRMLQDSGDDKAWVDAAHSLKGSARGVGAWQVADLCARAEDLAAHGTPAERSIALGDLKAAISEVVRDIDIYLKAATS